MSVVSSACSSHFSCNHHVILHRGYIHCRNKWREERGGEGRGKGEVECFGLSSMVPGSKFWQSPWHVTYAEALWFSHSGTCLSFCGKMMGAGSTCKGKS